jgi:hypothetical protein
MIMIACSFIQAEKCSNVSALFMVKLVLGISQNAGGCLIYSPYQYASMTIR